MAFAGLKKQFNKANQYVSEKMGAVEGTKLTDDYLEMERKTDVTIEFVDEMINKTKEYLQPNPATRAKMQISNKVPGGKGGYVYTQPEANLGESMLKCSKKLGEGIFSRCLNEVGEAFKQISDIKFTLEDSVKQCFIDPLTYVQNKEIKEVVFHRKKLESRRLDFDCKKRRKPTSQAEQVDLSLAQAKFEQSLNLAAKGMHNLLQNQIEHISQLSALAQALNEYHFQCSIVFEDLALRIEEYKNEAANQPQETYVPKKIDDLKSVNTQQNDEINVQPINNIKDNNHKENELKKSFNNGNSTNDSENAISSSTPQQDSKANFILNVPCCKALYDFVPENQSELPFNEGDIIELKSKIDDNWFEGTLKGKTGLFPIAYVRILIPLNK